MPGIIWLGLATGPMIAFGNAGRPITDGVTCARRAFIDRHRCGQLVSPVGEMVVWLVPIAGRY